VAAVPSGLSLNPLKIIRKSIYPSVCGSTALVDFGRFFGFLIYTQSVGLLGRVISQSQGRYLHTEQHRQRINAGRHPCFEWDLNPVHALDRVATVIYVEQSMVYTNLSFMTNTEE
jgi:hypothetical protein